MTLAIRLPAALEKRLNALAKKTERTKTYYVCKALTEYLDDMEDVHIAMERLAHPPKRYLTMEEVERKLGLADKVGSKSRKKPAKARKRRSTRNSPLSPHTDSPRA